MLSTGKSWLPGLGFMGPVSISSQSWYYRTVALAQIN